MDSILKVTSSSEKARVVGAETRRLEKADKQEGEEP
jgi:hypothetical protein